MEGKGRKEREWRDKSTGGREEEGGEGRGNDREREGRDGEMERWRDE